MVVLFMAVGAFAQDISPSPQPESAAVGPASAMAMLFSVVMSLFVAPLLLSH